jgi:sulfide:quinone oxidoreductase
MARLQAVHHRPTILIAGGGAGGLEALIALSTFVRDAVQLELMAPEVEFSYRPIAVAEPFGLGEVRRLELARIAADHGAHYRQAALASVESDTGTAVTDAGTRLGYDYLVVAVGAKPVKSIDGAVTFGGEGDRRAIEDLLQRIRAGKVRKLVFAAPANVAWLLPLYELALFTAAWIRQQRLAGVQITVVTPEDRPLEAFGANASDEVERLLAEGGTAVETSSTAEAFDGHRLTMADGNAIEANAVIALPRLDGPGIGGLPQDGHGFIPTDPHGAVRGVRRVYAAGDGTSFPIKQGGLAAQQADAVAAAIAAELGAVADPKPFRPVLRGLLLTGAEPRYLRAGEGGESSEVSFRALWWPPGKIAGRHITPYLARPDDPPLMREPFVDRPAPDESEREHAAEALAEEQEAVELLLALADANARRRSYDFAITCLDAAEDVGGPLPAARQRERRKWKQLAAEHGRG